MSKALLVPKPHQEHITHIKDFVWRFCVNYVALNAITRVIAFPIPRCDEAVNNSFGGSKIRWLMDAPSGYHQIRVAQGSQQKLAFAGPDGTKFTYLVMPFGPVNGPFIFIVFIHDLDVTWKKLATSKNIQINNQTNTKIIVDDIFSWAKCYKTAFALLRCQLQVCRSQNLSLSLRKSLFFPDRLEFVGIDVCADGNKPAQSKYNLLKTWPKPRTAQDIASFIGFIIFYAQFIPNIEHRIRKLRDLAKTDLATNIEDLWSDVHQAEMDDMINAILSEPCLMRFSAHKRCYLQTDFSSKGFGAVLLQPDVHACRHAPRDGWWSMQVHDR